MAVVTRYRRAHPVVLVVLVTFLHALDITVTKLNARRHTRCQSSAGTRRNPIPAHVILSRDEFRNFQLAKL